MANEAYQQAKKSALFQGLMQGIFFGTILGFSLYSMVMGYIMIKYEVHNPRAGETSSTSDIVGGYQACMFGMFTVISI